MNLSSEFVAPLSHDEVADTMSTIASVRWEVHSLGTDGCVSRSSFVKRRRAIDYYNATLLCSDIAASALFCLDFMRGTIVCEMVCRLPTE